jgi:hypothetical protein
MITFSLLAITIMNKCICSIILTFTISVLIGSCVANRNTDDRWTTLEHRLYAEAIYPEKEILDARSLVQTREHFILWQPENEREFSVFHLKGDSLLYDGAFLTMGRGPYEVNAGKVHYVPENNSVVIIGYNPYGKTFVIPIDSISNLFSHDRWQVYNTKHTQYSVEPIPMDTVSYLVHIIDDRKMFSMLDIRTQTMTEMGIEYPDDVSAPASEKALIAYGGQVSKRPRHDQFVYSSESGHYVAIYTYDENMQVSEEKIVFSELPKYSVAGEKIRRTDENVIGLSLSVSENYIYLNDTNLTLGDYRFGSPMEKNGYPGGYAKTIYVCDWEGNPVCRYELDRAVVYCTIDQNDEHLYAFAFDEQTYESNIVRFKLPKVK